MSQMPKSLIGEHPEVIAGFIVPFFEALDGQGIVWAVQHGWEGLPTYARHDVDLSVQAKDVGRVGKIIREVAERTGWKLYGHFRSSNLDSFWILQTGAEQSYFQIDVFREMTLRGIRFFPHESTKAALGRRWKNEQGIWCLTVGFAGASVLLKELVANGKLEGVLRYEQVTEAITKDYDEFHRLLIDAVRDEKLVDDLIAVCRRADWGALKPLAGRVRRQSMVFRLSDAASILRYGYDFFRLRFFPYLRLFVAVVGPDGCGKTTVIDSMCERFDHRPLCGIMRIHSHFGNVIRLRDIKKRVLGLVGKKIEFEPDPEPGTRGMGMQEPLSCLRSMFYILYYGVLLAMGRVTLWKWRKFSSLVVADRYYYDYYYMRGHMKSPKWFKDLVGVIVPKPDLVFFLDRPAEDIFAQKPELEIDEIKRQQAAIRELLDGNARARFIDASHGVGETVRLVNSEIEKWLSEQKG